jgi:hypothetical protein
MAVIAAREDGKKAYREGEPMIGNPYDRATPEHGQWIEGWKSEWWNDISDKGLVVD